MATNRTRAGVTVPGVAGDRRRYASSVQRVAERTKSLVLVSYTLTLCAMMFLFARRFNGVKFGPGAAPMAAAVSTHAAGIAGRLVIAIWRAVTTLTIAVAPAVGYAEHDVLLEWAAGSFKAAVNTLRENRTFLHLALAAATMSVVPQLVPFAALAVFCVAVVSCAQHYAKESEWVTLTWETRSRAGVKRVTRRIKVDDGYCYLRLFRRSRWASLVRVLGRLPRGRAVQAARPDYVGVYSWDGHTAHVSTATLKGADPLGELARRGVRIGVSGWICTRERTITEDIGDYARDTFASEDCQCGASRQWTDDWSLARCENCHVSSDVFGSGPRWGSYEHCPSCGQRWGTGLTTFANAILVVKSPWVTSTLANPDNIGLAGLRDTSSLTEGWSCVSCGAFEQIATHAPHGTYARDNCSCGAQRTAISGASVVRCVVCDSLTEVTDSGITTDCASNCPHCNAVWAVGDHSFSRNVEIVSRAPCWTSKPAPLGRPGATLVAHGPESATHTWVAIGDGNYRYADGEMYRPLLTEGGLRSPTHRNLHWLADRVVNSSLTNTKTENGLTALWDEVADVFVAWSKLLVGGSFVVVTALNANGTLTAAPVQNIIPEATHGVCFVSTHDANHAIHASWTVMMCPLLAGEGRALAGLRVLPLVTGRSDVEFAIVNGVGTMWQPVRSLQRIRESGIGLACAVSNCLPVNLGATFAAGGILRADYAEIRDSFGRYGLVYGWDESVLYARSPVAWMRDLTHTSYNQVHAFDFKNVTVLEPWVDGGFGGCFYPTFTYTNAKEVSAGVFIKTNITPPKPTINPGWAGLEWARSYIQSLCEELNVPLIGDGWARALPRHGDRFLNYALMRTDGAVGENAHGAIWRRFESAAGLRDRNDAYHTQGLNPELWNTIESPVLLDEAARHAYALTKPLVDVIRRWADGRPEVIGVASVSSLEMANEFKTARGDLFKSWVFLSEKEGETNDEQLWVQLPRVFGSGNYFQLARLLPAISGARATFSVVNDLVTDWIPRAERLSVGLAALELEPIVFPAMDVNSPCPFQDATYVGTALVDRRENLLTCLANWGWVYGYDEVWCGAHQLLTVAVRTTRCGGAATADTSNPKGATIATRAKGGNWKRYYAPRGAFRALLTSPETLRGGLVIPSLWVRAKTAFGWRERAQRLYFEFEPKEWEDTGDLITASLRDPLVIFTWGTHGDRVPIVAAARWMAAHSYVPIVVRHLVTLDEGRRMLAMCERDEAHLFIGALANASLIVKSTRERSWSPDYLIGADLQYSLRPGDADAAPPGGGLVWFIDWLVQLIFWKDRASVRIGLYRGNLWFPRSADGKTFLTMQPISHSREKVGVCIGSSTLPVPEEYKDYERVPAGDHAVLFQQYDTLITDGGAGKVQTARAAGVRKIVSTNNKIDRKYYTPDDCAKGCTGNEHPRKWLLALSATHGTFWAYVGLSPSRFATAARWHIARARIWSRLWVIAFFAYSFRKNHVLPTLTGTLAAASGTLSSNWIIRVVQVWAIGVAIRFYTNWTGRSLAHTLWIATRSAVRGAFSPVTSYMVSAGFSARRAILVGSIISNFDILAVPIKFGRFSGNEAGVYLMVTPVYVKGIPIGLHAAYYEPATQSCWEGVHRGHSAPGAPFRMRKRVLIRPAPFLAVKSEMTAAELDRTNRDVSRPYSAVWNCFTMLLGVFISHHRTIISAEVALLLFGSAYAGLGLLVLLPALACAASSTVVAALAVGPLDRVMGTHYADHLREAGSALWRALYIFADEDDSVSEVLIRDTAAIVAADAIKSGIDETTVFEAISDAVVAAAYSVETDDGPSDEIVRSLFETRRGDALSGKNGFAIWIALIGSSLRRATHLPTWMVEAVSAYLGAMLDWTEAVTIEVVCGLAFCLDFLESIGVPTHASTLATALSDRIANTTDAATRRKNVWAILSKKRLDRLRRSDWLALSLKPMTPVETDNPAGWLANLLNKFAPPGERLEEEHVYRVPSYLPSNPRVSEQEFAFPSLLHEAENVMVDPELTARVATYLSLGGEVGIDGMWTATDEMREKVTSRYFSEPNPLTHDELVYANHLAETLYELHPDAFKAPGVVRPETVRARLNMRGRSGVPFIQKVRTRRALESTGWMKSIISATYECLDSGVYPPDAYSEFAKMMVLPARTMTTKGPRTIMATSLVQNFVSGVYELERRTRKTWPTTDMGMGAPLTADWMGRIFEKIASRANVFSADATAFDANIPPIIFEVLARLAELGATTLPHYGSAIRAKYYNLQNSHIYDLPSGKVWKKNSGGATGQSATSWDNSWAMRIVMIAVWSEITGKPPREFYFTNSVSNTGDDNAWGSDDDLPPDEVSRVAKRLFGLDIRVETRGMENLAYLSKHAVPGAEFADEILRVLDHVPAWTAVHDTGRLLSRRAAVVSHASGRPFREYKRHLAERSVGHALLTAHNRPLYNLFANEWMEDTRRFIGARNYAVVHEISRDSAGDIESVSTRFTRGYTPTPEQQRRMREVVQGALKYPTYQRVLEAAYKTREVPPLSQYAHAAVRPTFEAALREKIVQARMSFHHTLPDALVKLAPAPTAAPYSPIFITFGYPVEKFVYRSMAPDTTLTEFAAELRQAPWSVATDPVGFWWYLDCAGGRERVLNESMLTVRGRMVVVTGVYALLTEGLHLLRAGRFGLLIEAWQIYTQDAPRLFALLDSLHWLETSRSSAVISSLTPKDPYANQKLLACSISSMIPDFLATAFGTLPTLGAFKAVSELIARVRTMRIGRGLDAALKGEFTRNRWDNFTPRILESLATSPTNALMVSAATSTGKSTEFVKTLLDAGTTRVWLVVPTRYLRDTYGNPWVSKDLIIKLSAGIVDNGAPIAVCTYGHICARQSAGVGVADGDIVLFDEFSRRPIHGTTAKFLAAYRSIFLTATPDWFYVPEGTPYINVPIERAWGELTPTRLDLPPMLLWAEAKKAGVDTSRCLFILPDVASVRATTLALLSAGETATSVTAKNRVMPLTGHIVGTSVLEAGVNIEPPATCLIDSGLMVQSNRGRVSTVPTTPSIATQRLGRVARRGEGAAYVNTCSGTGQEGVEYPTYLDLIAGAIHREWLLAKIGVEEAFVPVGPLNSRVDAYMRLKDALAYSRDERTALTAWWLLMANCGSVERANAAYDTITLTGWPEELDSVLNLLTRAKWLPARSRIQWILDSHPFICRTIEGVEVEVSLIRVRDGAIQYA